MNDALAASIQLPIVQPLPDAAFACHCGTQDCVPLAIGNARSIARVRTRSLATCSPSLTSH